LAGFEGEVPGADAISCGNYLDMNLPMAKYLAKRYLDNVLANISEANTYTPSHKSIHFTKQINNVHRL